MVAVAQLVRAPDCGSGGRGFETHQPPVTEIDLVLIYIYSEDYSKLYLAKVFRLSVSMPVFFSLR